MRLFASITSVEPSEIGLAARRLLDAGVDGLHVDICDGVFVPVVTFGPSLVRSLRLLTAETLDVHLMVTRPEDFIAPLADAGATRVSFHIESAPYPWRVTSIARNHGLEVGVALNPITPLLMVDALLESIDFLNLLTTEPDLAGERLLPGMAERIARARAAVPPHVRIEADGGITPDNIATFAEAGADDLVVGRAISERQSWPAAVAKLRAALPSTERERRPREE